MYARSLPLVARCRFCVSAAPLVLATALSTSCSIPEQPPATHAQTETKAANHPAALHITDRDDGERAIQKQPHPPTIDVVAAQQLPDIPLVELYPALIARAKAGDVEAKRQLFLSLYECRIAVSLRNQSHNYESDGIDDTSLKSIGIQRSPNPAQIEYDFLVAKDQKLEQCARLPKGAIEKTGQWLKEAAEGGDPYAQLTFFNNIDLIVGPLQEQVRSPNKVEKFKADSMQYLEVLADQRVPEAFYSLSSAYELGGITQKNLINAYAYRKAAGDIAPVEGNEKVLQILARDMTSQQVSKADELAHSLLQRGR